MQHIRRSWWGKDPAREQAAAKAAKAGGTIVERKDGITYIRYRPRHQLRMRCTSCGWLFMAGGIRTESKRDLVEREQRAIHAQVHKVVREETTRQQQKEVSDPDASLTVEKDSHAAELPHIYQEYTTRLGTASTGYVLVTGSEISSEDFETGEDYLIIVTAQLDTDATDVSAEVFLRASAGTTVFTDSECGIEMGNVSNTHYNYLWWTYQPSWVSGRDFHLELKTSNSAVRANHDQICITAIQLTPDLTDGYDFKHNLNSTSTDISSIGVDTTSNNASVSITPVNGSHKWLILSKARYGQPGVLNTTSVRSRISRSGELNNNSTIMEQQGEDPISGFIVLSGARVDTLGQVNNTYKEITTCLDTGAAGFVSVRRTHSGIFVLDLGRFENQASAQEDVPGPPTSATSNYAEEVHALPCAFNITGDSYFFSFVTISWGGTDYTGKIRRQIGSNDFPETQSTDSYWFGQYHDNDRLPVCIQSIETIVTVPQTYTSYIDASLSAADGPSRGTYTRTQVIFSFEMLTTIAIPDPREELQEVREFVKYVVGGTTSKLVDFEQQEIREDVRFFKSTTAYMLTAANFELHLSGGATNVNPALSLGGTMSTAPPQPGAPSDFEPLDYVEGDYSVEISFPASSIIGTRLLDDVSNKQAVEGDEPPPGVGGGDHRCFYVYNTHLTFTMQQPKLWISQNTPADDKVEIGLGTAAVNADEQQITDENTAPTSVVFDVHNSEATALSLPNIPPQQKKAVWIRRTVPPGTLSPHLENTYKLQVRFYTDHADY